MALPIDASSQLKLKDYGIYLFFKSGDVEIPIKNLSPTKERKQILETLVEVYEYKPLSLGFIDWNWDEEINVRIPSIDSTDEDEWLEFTLTKLNQRKIIYNPFTDDTFPWPCGVFLYEIHVGGHIFYGAFKIVPNNITQDQFREMSQFIEDELSGLTQNYHKITRQYPNQLQTIDSSQLSFLSWLGQSFSKLQTALRWIENENQMNIKRHYQVESHPGRIDQNSMKWENTFKGSIVGEHKFYNRKHTHNTNLPENQLVKYQVKEILQRIEQLNQLLLKEVNHFNEELSSRTQTINSLIIHLSKGKDPLVTQNDFQKLKNDLYGKELERDQTIKKLNQIVTSKQAVEQYKQQLQYSIQQPFWIKVDDTHPKVPAMVVQKGYVMFKRLWNEFFKEQQTLLTKQQEKLGEDVSLLHPTSKLYEYYAYLVVIKQLIEKGFQLEYDSLSHQLRRGFMHSQLQSGTTVILSDQESEIHLVYDKTVEHRAQEAIANKTYFFSKFSKKQPDIRIDLYRKQDDKLLYQSSIIVEVKYRPFQNIFSDAGNTKAMEQMNEYIGIKYYCPIRKDYFSRIREVLCFYPGNRNQPLSINTEAGKFIQLYPNREHTVGLEEINRIFDEWLR
ncbi:DUF2357 domain-containing protein [Aquibacillus halophilus]|uniref:DUF2357 domain-containing protein n=1 Tax=Aquibacillus halophilus TaxID=930132 RepID=A0A6A8D9U8_9BACI|nr:DUF2357 domain-containing protein [Aquibacillus halophilus]MRH41316.1 DUF2357 domain-containing protein [Aquibacillus halophilus]